MNTASSSESAWSCYVSLACALLLTAGAASSQVAEAPTPLSVCDLLTNSQQRRNTVVTVQGELIGTEEGLWLRGEKCPNPLVTSGYEWRNPVGIWLTPPESKMGERSSYPAPPVSPEWKAAKPLLEKYVGLLGTRVWVTVTGVFETRVQFELVLRGDGKKVPYGYGHLNGAPAQIVYFEFRDVEVKPAPAATPQPR
jgi:hypothetical protein